MLKDLKNYNANEIEQKVLKFWEENQIFEKSLKRRRGKKNFIFYEGPPTANGRPGIHHVLARSFKDIICRYKTMAGFLVERKAGWDTHGLPVELEVEKELGIKNKAEIEKYGVAEFNEKCRASVWKYKDEWDGLTKRMGFWLDLNSPYITYENNYIETLWWIIKQVWDNNLLYKGHKVVPWCTRCGTVLSSHELAQGYKETVENSIYVKFKLKANDLKKQVIRIGNHEFKDTYILSWTTTPWTLPGNVALAVGKNIIYSITEKGGDTLIVAEDSPLGRKLGNVGIKIRGGELVGLEYEPLFIVPALKSKTSYKVYDANFVTTTDGTGVVHTAVMYGEDDYNLGIKVGLPQHHTVDESGKFTKDVKGLEGLYVKSKEAEDKIISHLKQNNNWLDSETYTHDYPFCWRCGTPLLYYATSSWFIKMSQLKKKLIEQNKKVNWVPGHLKEGRFGEWLRELKDWAFSRERYWGTPLPIWQCPHCEKQTVIGSIEELAKLSTPVNNNYFLLRHGGANSNDLDIISSYPEKFNNSLTKKGKIQIEKLANSLKNKKIDLIFSSDVLRAKETAEIVSKKLGIKVSFNKQLREWNFGVLNNQPAEKLTQFYGSEMNRFKKAPEKGENLTEVRSRMVDFVLGLEKKYKNKNILIVSHGDPLWLLECAGKGLSDEKSIEFKGRRYPKNGDFRKIDFLNIPRDKFGRLDLHKPFIDEIHLSCPHCRSKMERVNEVADVWFDSGAMPFAQHHYPFENKNLIDKKIQFPADYISEAMDQTRGWFYTLLAVSVLLGKEVPYKNVVSLGLILDKFGKKMSKSKGNIVVPGQMFEKYGADVVRWYFFTVNASGESKRFDEKDLLEISRKFISILFNSLIFLKTYGIKSKALISYKKLGVLDKWILSRLNEVILKATNNLEKYEIVEAAREIEKLIDDLSRWYIRRSRRRFQRSENKKDLELASAILNKTLSEISKLIAPFTPFFADALYGSLDNKKFASVHLEDWPKADKKLIERKLIEGMEEVRELASLGLAKRAQAGIKVRQPLALLKIKNQKSKIKIIEELLKVLAEEINVKRVIYDEKIKEDIELDTKITPELKEEGIIRGLVRMVQDLRQEAGLKPQDKIQLFVYAEGAVKNILNNRSKELLKEVSAKALDLKKSDKISAQIETQLDSNKIWIGIRKI